MILQSIRLRNFRCFEDSGEIELKPLTVLVGANSSGKSSILKFFPLFKQSIDASIDGVFKWSSDPQKDELFVDFNNFENTVINNDTTKSIQMDFVFKKKDEGIFSVSESIGFDNTKKEVITSLELKSIDKNAQSMLYADFSNKEFNYEEVSKINLSQEQIGLVSKSQDNHFIPIFNNKKLSKYLTLVEMANDELKNLAKNIYYIQPLRMDTIRSYNLSNQPRTDILYSDASNLAYVLNNLPESDKLELNKWFTDNGFDITIDFDMLNRSEQILEIYVKTKGMPKSRNIIDMGFGFSQILPIIVLIWASIKEITETGFRDNQYSKIVVIEQPEVHLHPRYIGMFATIMSQAIQLCKDKKIPINFIVETHSFSLLNKIGSLVYKEKLDKRNVVVYRFNMNEETNISSIETSDYDEDGALVDWPIDFFDED